MHFFLTLVVASATKFGPGYETLWQTNLSDLEASI
jgi:hypothetical protein